ncbi:MAG: peptidase C45 [Ignavibacteriales bacterium]|nr:peptidase C45 [Ignavibacteriales bacterium]
MKQFALLIVLISTVAAADDPRLKNATRQDKNGWISVHLEGQPSDIGYQHGCLLAAEIDDLIRTQDFYYTTTLKRDWKFYRGAAERIFWPKLDKEYQDEIKGIAEGVRAKGYKLDYLDIAASNAFIEISSYYVPLLMEKEKKGSGENKAPGYCSAFIATGSYTADGKIVMAHNNWSEYIIGERWRVIADVKPSQGYHFVMDCLPGFIHSGDDFAINEAGLLYTETTITQFMGFDSTKTPEFVRARKAIQYGKSIDDFVRIMTTGNNGGYANDWLVGDNSTNEIARVELGLKNHRVWRTKDGVYVGANFASDEKLLAEETKFDTKDATSSPNARKIRWQQLVEPNKGRITFEMAKLFEGDHTDANLGASANNRCVLCGHNDEDSLGTKEWSWAPFFPGGAVQGKVTSGELAKDLTFWARMGHPCGADFLAEPFFKAHPEHAWQGKFLKDMKSYPWTMVEAKR